MAAENSLHDEQQVVDLEFVYTSSVLPPFRSSHMCQLIETNSISAFFLNLRILIALALSGS
jgi:hypothetical protein